MNAFTRLAAIFVGLANLAVLIVLEVVAPLFREETWCGARPYYRLCSPWWSPGF
jgi:hypothetical protein